MCIIYDNVPRHKDCVISCIRSKLLHSVPIKVYPICTFSITSASYEMSYIPIG